MADDSTKLKSTSTQPRHGRGVRPWREPLVHFFLLGFVVLGLYGVLKETPEVPEDRFMVEITSQDIEWFRTMWRKRMGREPTVEELRGQVNRMIRDQVLSREAVALGLDEGDLVIRRRLAQKMDFLFTGLAEAEEPSDEELQELLDENPGDYQEPGRVSFRHVYFNTEQRGEDPAGAAARQLADQLNSGAVGASDVSTSGDSFLLPTSFSNETVASIQGQFGPRFAEALEELEPGAWHAPVVSAYGLHAVRVEERTEPRLPDFSDLTNRLREDWLAKRQHDLAAKTYEKLRARYRVLVEGLPYDLDTGESTNSDNTAALER